MSNLWRMLALAWLGGIGSPNLNDGIVESEPATMLESMEQTAGATAPGAIARWPGPHSLAPELPECEPPRSENG
jgi:hypothetical protein